MSWIVVVSLVLHAEYLLDLIFTLSENWLSHQRKFWLSSLRRVSHWTMQNLQERLSAFYQLWRIFTHFVPSLIQKAEPIGVEERCLFEVDTAVVEAKLTLEAIRAEQSHLFHYSLLKTDNFKLSLKHSINTGRLLVSGSSNKLGQWGDIRSPTFEIFSRQKIHGLYI